MGSGVSPVVQVIEVGDLRGVDRREDKPESEPLEIGLNGLERGILLAEQQCRGELSLNGGPKRDGDGSRANLRAFRIEHPAKALEVRTEQHDVTAKAFIEKGRIRWDERRDTRALSVDLGEAGYTNGLPFDECCGRHGWPRGEQPG